MPRPDSTSRAKSVEPVASPPLSPHRVKLPNTPAPDIRSNPFNSYTSTSTAATTTTKTPTPSSPPTTSTTTKDSRATSPPVTSATKPAVVAPPSASPASTKGISDTNEGVIDMEIFGQILEMDDDEDDRDFSKSIVINYFEQAVQTFDEIDEALEAKDLKKLAELGHFLKGSSAALGVAKVQASCELIQNYGHLRGATEEVALNKIGVLSGRVRVEYTEAEAWLKDFFKGEV